jgi:hypothetical protein
VTKRFFFGYFMPYLNTAVGMVCEGVCVKLVQTGQILQCPD